MQRAKEAPCTCTVKTSMEEMELLERRYIAVSLCLPVFCQFDVIVISIIRAEHRYNSWVLPNVVEVKKGDICLSVLANSTRAWVVHSV